MLEKIIKKLKILKIFNNVYHGDDLQSNNVQISRQYCNYCSFKKKKKKKKKQIVLQLIKTQGQIGHKDEKRFY